MTNPTQQACTGAQQTWQKFASNMPATQDTNNTTVSFSHNTKKCSQGQVQSHRANDITPETVRSLWFLLRHRCCCAVLCCEVLCWCHRSSASAACCTSCLTELLNALQTHSAVTPSHTVWSHIHTLAVQFTKHAWAQTFLQRGPGAMCIACTWLER